MHLTAALGSHLVQYPFGNCVCCQWDIPKPVAFWGKRRLVSVYSQIVRIIFTLETTWNCSYFAVDIQKKSWPTKSLENPKLFVPWTPNAHVSKSSVYFIAIFNFFNEDAFFYILPKKKIFHLSTAGAAQQQHSDFHSFIHSVIVVNFKYRKMFLVFFLAFLRLFIKHKQLQSSDAGDSSG